MSLSNTSMCLNCCKARSDHNGPKRQTRIRQMVVKVASLVAQILVVLALALIIRMAEVQLRRTFRISHILKEDGIHIPKEELAWENDTTAGRFSLDIQGKATMRHKFTVKGCIFIDPPKGPCTEIKTDMMSSLLHRFSPYIEEKVKRKYVDPPGDNAYYVLSPAIAYHRGYIHMFNRVMLDRMRYRYTTPRRFPQNQFLTNYIYHETLDRKLTPVLPGYLLGIPTPVFPLDGDGAMDPRVFQLRDKLYLMVLLFTNLGDKLWKPHPLIWDVQESKALVPQVNITYNEQNPMEKNWSPLVVNDTLYLVYNLDPLRVLQCDLDDPNAARCHFVLDTAEEEGFIFERRKHTLRGGTPFMLYEWPYYISLAHSVIICQRPDAPFGRVRRYEANIVILRADLGFRIVYVSSALRFSSGLYRNNSMVYYKGQILVENDFTYPVSIIKEDPDSLALGAHVNDHVSVLLRLSGFKTLMDTVKSLEMSTRRRVTPLDVQYFVKGHFPRPINSS